MDPDRPVSTVVVAEDAIARSGLAALLRERAELSIVGSLAPGDAGALAALRADVAIVDAGASGLEASRDVLGALPGVVLVLGEPQAAEALAAGARGVLFRGAGTERMAAALLAAARGLVVVDPALATWIRPAGGGTGGIEAGLTPREAEVLGLLAEGLANKGIAQRLGISERTARFHVESILAKLGAESRSEAIVVAARRGLVTL